MSNADVYAARGYGSRPLGFGAKPGLVVVDFQRGFTEAGFPMGGAPMVDRGSVGVATSQGGAAIARNSASRSANRFGERSASSHRPTAAASRPAATSACRFSSSPMASIC